MGLKFKLTLHKEFEIDTDTDWDKDLDPLYEALKDSGVDPGETASVNQITDAIKAMLENEIDSVVDLDLDETNFTVEVPTGTTLEVPEEEENEDED